MHGSKLIELFKTLTKEEVKLFGNHLEGAGYRNKSGVVLLFNYLKKWYPDFPENKIPKEVAYKKIAGKEYNNKRMRDLMSILSLNLEKFLIKQEIEEDEIEKEFIMLRLLKKRGQDKLYFQKVKQIQKKWETKPPKGIEQYYNEYRLIHDAFNHPSISGYTKQEINIKDVMEKLDQYYFATKLSETVHHYHHKRNLIHTKEERPILLVSDIQEKSNLPLFDQNIHILLFNKLLNAYKKDDYSDYIGVKKLYFEHIDLFSKSEQLELYYKLQRFCTQNYWAGKTEYLKEFFELNKLVIEKNIVIIEGLIKDDLYRTIVRVACVAGELEWTAKFIKEYQVYLHPSKRNDVAMLSEASLEFHKKNFDSTLDKLTKVTFQDVLFGVSVRYMQLQCYYELENYEDVFDNLTNSFAAFLSRNEVIGPSVKEASLNFIKYIKKLQSIKLSFDKKTNGLIQELEKTPFVSNKKWLIEKAMALES